jgi:putative intracellular protease/amidase
MSLKDPNPVNARNPKRVAIVISNPAISTTTGWPVGFWWAELTHPYFAFTEKGYLVTIFSPNGGPCQADGMSDPRDPSGYSSSDLISMGFIATPALAALVNETKPISLLNVGDVNGEVKFHRCGEVNFPRLRFGDQPLFGSNGVPFGGRPRFGGCVFMG